MSFEWVASRWRLSALAVLVLFAALLGQTDAAWAAFHVSTSNSGDSWATDTLDPPTALAFSRPCTVTFSPPSYVAGTTGTAPRTGSAVLTRPTGTVSGDLLVAFSIVTDDTTDNNATTPAGWTRQIDQYHVGHGSNVRVFTKIAGGSEPASYTFSGFDTSDYGAVVLSAYRGVDTANPIDVKASQTNAASTTATAPSVTTTQAEDRLVVGVVGISTTTAGTPSGMSAHGSAVASTDVIAVFDQSLSASGATGTRTSALTASRASIGVTLALHPAPGVPDPTVHLTWTPTTDTYATGYDATRTGGGTTTVPVTGRATSSFTDSSTSATQAYTYSLVSVYGNWRSSAATVSVPAC